MDFELSEEQAMLRDVSRSALKSHASPEQVRAMAGDSRGDGGELWRLGGELGWTGLALPEEHGGSGQGLVELCLVAEELGRAAAPDPFLPTAVVGLAVVTSGSGELRETVLPQLAGGSAAAAWALAEPGGGWTAESVRATAVRDGQGFVIDGRKTAVQDADHATWLLVTALLDGEPVSFLVDRGTPGVTVRRQKTLDETRAFHEVRLEAVHVPETRLLGRTAAPTRRLCDAAAVLTAGDSLGAAERLLEMTVEYAKVRKQFGRPIGSFQAIKHKCSDMLMLVRGARAAVHYAAMALDADAEDAGRAASVAKSFASEALSRVAGEALQTHGGIGFTWEHDLHLYLRRVKTNDMLHGSAAAHRERLCALLLEAPSAV
ncbi:acyl-CoA dehydrogenase family protein [Streptomyces sp. SID4956]|uniref:acyl-CoA dehydrogenase family protein n=1 Tax=Streptomyces sp. SID4956 TaxID=2690290 RepID=UPI001369BDE3|nr:acyl-CoA dehydrogenase [Streptomyces sp. SID4956]